MPEPDLPDGSQVEPRGTASKTTAIVAAAKRWGPVISLTLNLVRFIIWAEDGTGPRL